jgi:magnesium transporter
VITSSFEIDDALHLIAIPPEHAVEASKREDARIWINLVDPAPAELEEWLDQLAVKDLPRQLYLEARDRPGFYPLKREMFLVMPFLLDTEGAPEVDYVACLCRENLLLSVRTKTAFSARELTTLQQSEAWLPARSIAGLVSAFMIQSSLLFLGHATELRRAVLAWEDRMDRDPDTVEARDILDLRTDLVAIGAAVNDQLPTVQALSESNTDYFHIEEAREYLNCALVNLRAVHGSLAWLDGRIEALRAGLQMHAQNLTNRRLNVLTIFTAIFNPLTFMAGIWGMNFAVMPELNFPYAYPGALGLMLLIGIFMYFFFRRRGWFD